MSAARELFATYSAADLNPERHAVLALPTEGAKNSHRVPIRAAADDGSAPFLPGKHRLVAKTPGLRRLLVKFPESYCHSIKEYDTAEGERTNLSLGFALYDPRDGPTPEESRVIDAMDAFAAWIRSTMVGSERIRTTVGLGPATMSEGKQRDKAESMDLWVAKPVDEATPAVPNHAATRGGGAGGEPPRPRGRYVYVKLVAPSPTVNEMFHTYWWAPNGTPLTLDAVRRMQNFRIVPFIEMEDVFCGVPVLVLLTHPLPPLP